MSANKNKRAVRKGRPALFFSTLFIRGLRERIKREEVFKSGWESLIKQANEFLKQEFVSESHALHGGGNILHGNYGEPSKQVKAMGETLGLAYLATGQACYAEKLRGCLLHYSSYSVWEPPETLQWHPPWRSGLATAAFNRGYAIGYDCLRDFLTEPDRNTIVDGLCRLGIKACFDEWLLPGKRFHCLDSMGHNFWSVNISQAGLAALALLDDVPESAEWVERAMRSLNLWFSYEGNPLMNRGFTFDRAGAFYEGVNYINYALAEYLVFRLAYKNVFPDRKLPPCPALEQATEFFLHSCYPSSSGLNTVNFGDCSLTDCAGDAARLLLANGLGDGKTAWYIARAGGYDLSSPFGILCEASKREPESPSELPLSKLYRDVGWAVARSSWDNDATLLAVKCGATYNHAHADAGSFIVFHGGKPLIIDSGTCGYFTQRKDYIGYYVASKAHNVILFNGEGQQQEDIFRGSKLEGRIHRLLGGQGVKYILADAVGPMSKLFNRCFRHFVWVEDAIIVFDEIRSHEPGSFEWLLHYGGQAQRLHAGLLISHGKGRAWVRSWYPECWRNSVAEREVPAAMGEGAHQSCFVFSPGWKSQEMKFATSILLLEEGKGDDPSVFQNRVQRLNGYESVGLRVRHNSGMITDVYLNFMADGQRLYLSDINKLGCFETDASVLAVTRPEGSDADDPGALARFFVGSGSFLRASGKPLLESASKVFAVVSPGDRIVATIEGQPECEVELLASREPKCVELNGVEVEYDFNLATELVRVVAGGPRH